MYGKSAAGSGACTTVDALRRLCRDDAEALDAFDYF